MLAPHKAARRGLGRAVIWRQKPGLPILLSPTVPRGAQDDGDPLCRSAWGPYLLLLVAGRGAELDVRGGRPLGHLLAGEGEEREVPHKK